MNRPVALIAHPSPDLYGSDRVLVESVRALIARDWEVVVALPHHGSLTDLLRQCGARTVQCRTPVLRKAALRPRGFLQLLGESVASLVPMLRLLRATRPRVVYVNTVTVPMWPVLARLARRPVLVHVHEAEETVPAPVRTALATPLLPCAAIVVNSAATAAVLHRAIPLLKPRIRLVYNGVAGPPEAVPRSQRTGDPPRIVLVGRLSPRKGTDTAVEALARLHAAGCPATLDLVGSVFAGYEWYEQQLRELVRQHRLEDAVHLWGFDTDVWDSYSRADIALVPSRYEPFGNTSVEAQLAGVPVVVTDVQGLPETVESGRWGRIVPPDDPESLARAIRALLDDWPQALETARLAREHAGTRFAPDRYHHDIAALVAEVADRHH